MAKYHKFCVKVYQEVCTEVDVSVGDDVGIDTITAIAHEKACQIPLDDWQPVPDSLNTDAETDIQPIR